MTICKNCGVEYEDELNNCPLCSGEENNTKPASPADVLGILKKENKRQLWELSMVLIFSTIVITLVFDAMFGKGIRWSLFTTVSLLYLASVLTIPYFFRKPLPLLGLLTGSTLLLLFFINLLTGKNGWFLPLALPVTIAFFLLTGLVVLFNSLSRYKGLNLLATIFISLSLFVIVIEIFTDMYVNGIIRLQWSVVTAASLTIMALILVYIHYRLKHGHNLDRIFHV
jgi:hypothetical protein